MRIGNLMTSTLSTTPSLLLMLDSQMAYSTAVIDESRRSSDQQSGANDSKRSSKQRESERISRKS